MDTQKEKKSLQELVKQQLEAKKSKASGGKVGFNDQPSMKMKSQQSKKVGTTRRKMGV
ncbi:hypothetical protein ACFOZY_12615 [Chungangia koreensis]|uniref:Uncharacterized protein n=1 Tax=Chungangia koreensis TaxID=752657 RepID=A0ABV8X8C1_9LACT